MAIRIWIDTDLGSDVDDAFALAFALRHPELELVGVSTVFGDVELRARIAEELLRLGGAEGVPVLAGLGKPLTETRIGLMFGNEGRGLLEDASPRMRTESDPDPSRRIDALTEAVEAARADAMVAIGPLTNVAALLRAGVQLPRLSIMGGKTAPVEIEGVTPTIDEWNWHCDPDAAETLLEQKPPRAGLPRIFPAEITFRTAISAADHAALGDGDALCRALAAMSDIWLEKLKEFGNPQPQILLHDPLTVASLPAPDLCPMEALRLERDGEASWARRPGPANVEVATDVDSQRIRDLVMEALLGG
jgi:purine nucleosidase